MIKVSFGIICFVSLNDIQKYHFLFSFWISWNWESFEFCFGDSDSVHSKSVNTMRMTLEQVVLIVSSLLLFHDILPCSNNTLRLFVKISEVYSSWRSIRLILNVSWKRQVVLAKYVMINSCQEFKVTMDLLSCSVVKRWEKQLTSTKQKLIYTEVSFRYVNLL